eukprot:297540_1
MQSSSKWLSDVGCLLLTMHHQKMNVIHDVQSRLHSIQAFYDTIIYRNTKQKFKNHNIQFVDWQSVVDPPSPVILLEKIYCSPYRPQRHRYNNRNDEEWFIQFPVFLSSHSIRTLNKLNLSQLSLSLSIQFYYVSEPNNRMQP